MSTQPQTSDIENVAPEDKAITTRSGIKIEITTIKVKHLKSVMSAVTPLYYAFKANTAEDMDYLALVSNHTDEVVALTATLTNQTVDTIGELDIDELVQVFSEVVRKNLDFFIKNVLPALSGALEHVATEFRNQLGSTSSNG